jgi:putative membrane protein
MKTFSRISPARIARATITFAFAAFSLWLVLSGKIGFVLHPRMTPWILVSTALFLLFAIGDISNATKPIGHEVRLLLFLPLVFVMSVIFLATDVDPQESARLDSTQKFNPNPMSPQPQGDVPQEDDIAISPAPPLPAVITLSDKDYWDTINRIFEESATVAGKRLTVQGFVFREKSLPKGYIIVARNLMWCCSADVSVIGIVAKGVTLAAYEDNTWVEVTGVLGVEDIDMFEFGQTSPCPVVNVASIRRVAKPESVMVFPY